MRDGGLNVFEIREAKQPANRAIRAMTAETYEAHIGARDEQSKGGPNPRRQGVVPGPSPA